MRSRPFASAAKGGDSDFQTQDVRGIREEKGIVIGVVKVNSHPARMGNLSVFVPTFADKSREQDPSQWRQVKYCTPFYSRTELQGSGDKFETTKNAGGMIYPCPDTGTKVLCFFPEGRNQDGFWFACAPDTYMTQGLPEPSASSNINTSSGEIRGTKAPAGEFNDSDNQTNKISNFLVPKRSFDRSTHSILKTQGLDLDETRGLTSSSFNRETPSELFGITTKGRRTDINGRDIKDRPDIISALKSGADLNNNDANAVEGKISRKQGHSLTMDDGDIEGENNLIRLRTAAGHQILMHDSEDLLYIGNSKGTCWVQLDATGQLDIFSERNINLRSKSINMHADNNIKMHAGGQVQIVSNGLLHLEGKQMANLYSDGQTLIFGAKGMNIKSSGAFAIEGTGVGIKSSGKLDLQASCISLNGSAGPAAKQNAARVLSKSDTRPNGQGFWESTSILNTTVDRVPTHEPFAQHSVITSETTKSTVEVGNIPTSGNITVAGPNRPIKTTSLGLSTITQEFNDQEVDVTNVLKQPDYGISVEEISADGVRHYSAAVLEVAGSGGDYAYEDDTTNALGKYGVSVATLQKHGYVRQEVDFNGELDNPRMWTGKDGIDGKTAFKSSTNLQEDLFVAGMVDDYGDAKKSGAIQNGDPVSTITGMLMVAKTSSAKVASQFREGLAIDVSELVGRTNISTVAAALPQLKNFFNKGVASAKQVEKTAKLAALAAAKNKASIYRNISGQGEVGQGESETGPGVTGQSSSGGPGNEFGGGGGIGSSESGQQGDPGAGADGPGGEGSDGGDAGDAGQGGEDV